MRKITILAAVFLLAFAFCSGSVLACDSCGNNYCPSCTNTGITTVKGVIYEGNLSNGIKGANVTVTCYHNGSEYTKNAVSWNNGKYMVFFQENKCDYGDSLTVSAEKSGMSGTNSGTVNMTYGPACFDLNVGVVNVPLIPEFGIAIGALTMASAIGIFFFVRRK